MKNTFFILLIIIMTGCTSKTEYIKQHQWKFGNGFWIGDWLSFDNAVFKVQNDTIFKNDTAQAVVIDIDRQLGNDVELTIASLKTNEAGVYHEK